MGSIIKNIIAICGLIAVAAVGYYLIVTQNSSSITSGNSLEFGQAEQETEEFLRRLDELQAIELSATIFTDPKFNSLVEYSVPVEPVPFGRENPFLIQ